MATDVFPVHFRNPCRPSRSTLSRCVDTCLHSEDVGLIITLDDTILMGYHSCDDQTLQMQRDEVDIQWPFLQEAAAEHTTDS